MLVIEDNLILFIKINQTELFSNLNFRNLHIRQKNPMYLLFRDIVTKNSKCVFEPLKKLKILLD